MTRKSTDNRPRGRGQAKVPFKKDLQAAKILVALLRKRERIGLWIAVHSWNRTPTDVAVL